MGIGYLLGGLAALIYMLLVGYFGGIKKSPGVLRLVKMKLNKNMTDKNAVMICLVMSVLMGALGIFLLIFGATR